MASRRFASEAGTHGTAAKRAQCELQAVCRILQHIYWRKKEEALISMHLDEDLRCKAEWTFQLYGLSLGEAVTMFLEKAVDYPLLVSELGLAQISPEALTELRELMVGL